MIPRNSNDNKNEQKLILDLDFFQKKKKIFERNNIWKSFILSFWKFLYTLSDIIS